MDEQKLDRIDDMAKHLNRSRSWIINQALDRFLEYEEWLVTEVKEGLKEVERGEIASDEEVAATFRKWGANVD